MNLKYIIPILFITLFLTSCSNDDDEALITNEVEGLLQIQEITNSTHTIELFSKSGMFTTGYNTISMRLKDNETDSYIENASLSWMPMMQMPNMQHSCPKSSITKAIGKDTVYKGFIIYQMTNTDGTGWTLNLQYSIDDIDYTASSSIIVNQSDSQNVTSFMGSDQSRYVVALIEPNNPIIGINDLIVGIYKMETMVAFPEVTNYTIALDPRMPGMGNHSSPNNTDLSYNAADHLYHANLSLTMSGYWVLNLKLMNDQDEVLKGEDVTENNDQSSFYLELEF
ncbi:hypothetical protein [Ichthyenterobacterium magnum]|uniref:YtkA-like protein n=1 Tax=Ichthyenterobacterium magnum TaxID=1230530 RepID=A0A420DVA6_9FLAO|nr:hypothetical protein [Ichthyenterobacterium magnum]RKE98153.1 hypothetical protein BXY80_0227 [Ichthyenterobacterium magnum]